MKKNIYKYTFWEQLIFIIINRYVINYINIKLWLKCPFLKWQPKWQQMSITTFVCHLFKYQNFKWSSCQNWMCIILAELYTISPWKNIYKYRFWEHLIFIILHKYVIHYIWYKILVEIPFPQMTTHDNFHICLSFIWIPKLTRVIFNWFHDFYGP